MLRLGREVMILDGGMGSELERAGLTGIPEDYNVTHAEAIRKIHCAYADADIITANTFGLNAIKYRGKFSLEEVALKAIENARAAGKPVFFDVGPTGAMLAPMGTLSFDEAYRAFKQIALITKDLVDGYIAETFTDLYEAKACVLALKEYSDKPVFATMTFDKSGRTLTGSTPEIVANTLEGLGADAVGVNCSLGPDELYDVVGRFLAVSNVPVLVQPNCGLPVLKDGKTCYNMGAEEFARHIRAFLDMGVSVVGGCCGTTPEFIRKISAFRGMKVCRPKVEPKTVINSATRLTVIEGVKICGERLNPTGKKRLKEALLQGDYDYLVDEAVRQQEAGADFIDLNVGIPKIDEASVMQAAVQRVQEYSDLPLQIDSSNAEAIERGVRYYNGIPLINSVNGEDAVMERIFPIAKKYGAIVLGLAMDGRGVPKTARERYEIAQRILSRAEEFGIPRHKVMIDTLVVTASAEQTLVKETLEGLRLVSSLGVKTALGVSNVSFGLPNRALLNRTFLSMAMACGLNAPILNPLDRQMLDAVRAFRVLSAEDANAEEYIRYFAEHPEEAVSSAAPAPAVSRGRKEDAPVNTLYDCVRRGMKNQAERLTRQELLTRQPMEVVNDLLVKALQDVGALYEEGKLFLPQLIAAAETAKIAFPVAVEFLPCRLCLKGTVVLATVLGDVHDIGKNIVKVVLQSYGYQVIDLGKDTPVETVVNACLEHRPLAVGLSALMTTTVVHMEETIKALRAANCTAKIFVGGAVLNAETAKEIGADYYTKDATEFVNVLERL